MQAHERRLGQGRPAPSTSRRPAPHLLLGLQRGAGNQVVSELVRRSVPRVTAGPVVVQRGWDPDHERGIASWIPEPGFTPHSHPDTDRMMRSGLKLVVDGAVIFDPHIGRRRGGGGGFALGGGTSSSAVFQGPGGGQGSGTPSVPHPDSSETVDYGWFASHHQGVTPQTFPPTTGFGPAQAPPTGVRPLSPDLTSSFVSPDVISHFEGRRNDTTAFPTQGRVMGGLSAREAMEQSGRNVPGQMDWLHRHRFAHGGVDHRQPQTQENLVSGTHGSNIRHLVLEDAVSHATGMAGAVPTSTGLHNPISEAHHTYESMDYTIHSPFDPSIALSSNIDLLSPQMPRRPDQGFANQGVDRFMGWATVHQLIESGAMSPEDLGPQGLEQYTGWLNQHQRW